MSAHGRKLLSLEGRRGRVCGSDRRNIDFYRKRPASGHDLVVIDDLWKFSPALVAGSSCAKTHVDQNS